jgi:hypothetical protein
MSRLGSSPAGIRKVGNKLVDDVGDPATIVRGGITNVDLVGGVIPNPATPVQPTSGVLWTADYDAASVGTSVNPPWGHVQKPNNPGLSGPIRQESMQIIAAGDVPGSGTYKPSGKAMYVNLLPHAGGTGDVNASGSSNRAEVYDRFPNGASGVVPGNWPDPVDSTRWYGFSVYVPVGFTTNSSHWFDLTQWKGYRGGSPPLAVEISNTVFKLGGTKSATSLGSISPGNWTRLVFGIHWSPVAANGWVNVFVNGSEVIAQRSQATMDYYGSAPDPTYLKQGIYRSASWTTTAELYFGPIKVGYSQADVAT